MKVLFVSPEVNPIVRTGGLGDVVGSLPLALSELGVDVRVICPMHRVANDIIGKKHPSPLHLKLGDNQIDGSILESRLGASTVPVYLINSPELYDRDGVYADENGDFSDNPQRAFALCQAALEIERITGWRADVFHAHDWMAAAVCGYVNAANEKKPKKNQTKSVLTIHNLQHQGVFSHPDFLSSGLPKTHWGMDGFEHEGALNLLKGGIQHADKITTVSPTYANEIRTAEYGCGLEASLQYRGADLIGILNGIDEFSWDPQKDSALTLPINPSRPKAGKNACKKALLNEFKMDENLESPLFGVVSRLCDQKGLDLLMEILPQLMAETHANFTILGSGEAADEQAIKELSASFPNRIGVNIGFDDGLARRIFAGSDFFLMPSRFEPCGLAQQYAMRYGSLPIARKTGGLADTIRPIAHGELSPNGFLFSESTGKDLWKAIQEGLRVFANNRKFTQLRKNALSQPCSWEQAARQYLQTYNWTMEDS
ncbi:glycogen synthase GlgA [Opitutales bacterium]|nr:glycogen synthase GlgA [Opitutales bacterium]